MSDEKTWKEKYELLIHKTVKDLEESSLEAQRQSELNLEVSRNYISELKTRLHRSQEKVKLLEEKLNRKSSDSVVCVDPPPTSQTTPISISSDDNRKGEKGKRGKDTRNFSSLSKRRKSSLNTVDSSSNGGDQFSIKRLEFFEAVTCLTVHVQSTDDSSTVYLCTLDDGDLMGHEFSLELSYDNWEYTYSPVKPSLSLPSTSQLKDSFFFPDYMLPRFLIKLLDATYKNENRPLKP